MNTVLALSIATLLCDVEAQRNFKNSIAEVIVFDSDRYANVTYKVKSLAAGEGLNVYVTLKQNLPNNLKARLACLKDNNGKLEFLLIDYTMGVCQFLKSRTGNPLFLGIFNALRQLGRMPQACPIKKGNYYINNLIFAEDFLPAIMPPIMVWILDVTVGTETVFNLTVKIRAQR